MINFLAVIFSAIGCYFLIDIVTDILAHYLTWGAILKICFTLFIISWFINPWLKLTKKISKNNKRGYKDYD